MAINFPDSPSNGDIYTVSGKQWQYVSADTKWIAYGASLAPDVLKVDSGNNRVGINQTSPAYGLDVTGTARVTGVITASGGVVGNVTGNTSGTSGSTTGNAATATALATARTIGGVSFDGTANIAVTLAATATALANARTIGGTSFDGTAAIVPGTITVADTTDTTCFVGLWESATGDIGPKSDAGITYNAGTGTLTATAFAGPLTGNVTGNASGTALTVTQAAQSAITSTGTLTGVTVSGTGTIGVAVGQAVDLDRKTADYTLVLTDAGKVIEINSGSDENVTIPPNSSVAFPTGTQIVIVRLGAGAVTIVEGSGVTTRSDEDKAKIKSQYSSCVLIKHETNEWYILGNLDS